MEDATSIIKSRRRPLYTIGFSIISIAQILFKRALETNGPLGTIAERIVIITSPHLSQSIHKIQFHILSILTILDDCALSISTTIESRVPLLTYFFDKMDVLVHTIETLPEKIDDVVVNVVPFVIRHIPFLKLAVTLWLKLLNLLIVHAQAIVCRLDHHNNNRTKKSSDVREEKEIRVVDTSYNDDVMVDKDGGSPLLGRSSGDDDDYGVTEETLPPLLEENGLQRKNGHDKDEDIKSTTEGSFYEDDECSVATSQEDDPIVQLFEWGWVTPNTGTFVTPTQSSSNL